MFSRSDRRILLIGVILIVAGALLLVNRFVALSPWVWAAFLTGASLGALGLYVADRSDRLMPLAAYVAGAAAGLIALVPTGFLRDEAVACYVLLAVALPFLAVFALDRARWWALIPAYPLLVILGAIGLAASGLVSDDLISAYVMLALALPFLVIYARDRGKWWALIAGLVLTALGLSFGSWLPWHAVRSTLIAGGAVGYAAALGLLVTCACIAVRVASGRDRSGKAGLSRSGGTAPSGTEIGEPPAA